jgi:hypothetical protein
MKKIHTENRRLNLGILSVILGFLLATGMALSADAPAPDAIDWDKARALHQREQKGEPLTADEQAYLDRAKAERQKGNASKGPTSGKPAITGQESTGLVPLSQMKADQKYKGFDGGLYGGGSNQPPEAQAKAARDAAAHIIPLDAAGKPATDGKIVLMSIGMSNTTGEFSRFKQVADADPDKSPKLLIVDGAQGGKDAAAWANVGNGITNPTWEEADHRLKSAGASPGQVQVIWIKQALAGPPRRLPRPRTGVAEGHGNHPDHRQRALPEPAPGLSLQPHLCRLRHHHAQPGALRLRRGVLDAVGDRRPDERRAKTQQRPRQG